jgi:hypothetical protein
MYDKANQELTNLDSVCGVFLSSARYQVSYVELENLSFRQVAVGIFLLTLLNWTFLQFIALPNMSEHDRKEIYAGWISLPYSYAISVALILAFGWFAFSYRGRHSTRGRRIAAFGMALAGLCGMLLISVVRVSWRI